MKHIKIVDITKKIPFLDQEVEIRQLTVKGVRELQTTLDKSKDDVSGLSTLSGIFKATVIGAEGMKDKDFRKLSLSKHLQNYQMRFWFTMA